MKPARLPDRERNERFREAARRLYGQFGVEVPQWAAVQVPADQNGAYVEALVWVPASEIDRK